MKKRIAHRLWPITCLILCSGAVAQPYLIIRSPWNRTVKFDQNGNVLVDGKFFDKLTMPVYYSCTDPSGNNPHSMDSYLPPRGSIAFVPPGVSSVDPNERAWVVDGHLWPNGPLHQYTAGGSFPSINALRISSPDGTLMACYAPTGELYLKGAGVDVIACSNATYEPLKWNDDGDVQLTNKCYNYCNDEITYTQAQPGEAHDFSFRDPFPDEDEGAYYVALYTAAAVADGLTLIGPDFPGNNYVCANGGHLVYLAYGFFSSMESDFHWFRLDKQQMTWSHKPGQAQATDRDYDPNSGTWTGNIITNPLTANRGSYDIPGNFFCTCGNDVVIK
jgi:hypothetical protein